MPDVIAECCTFPGGISHVIHVLIVSCPERSVCGTCVGFCGVCVTSCDSCPVHHICHSTVARQWAIITDCCAASHTIGLILLVEDFAVVLVDCFLHIWHGSIT